MNTNSRFAAVFSRLCMMMLIAIVSASPTLMSAMMDRGHELPKLMLVAPLALFALAAALLAFGWHDTAILSGHAPTRIASYALGIFVCMAGITTALSARPTEAFFGSFFRMEGLMAWLAYGAVFFAILASAKMPGAAKGLVDSLIFASLVPAFYAVQQSMALDFFVVAGSDPARANSTHGNPVQLAEYLSLIVPLTIARISQIRPRWLEAAPWLIALLAQLAGMWVTQTRGPLLACIAGLIMLTVFWAAFTRKRSLLFVAVGVILVSISFLASINLTAQPRSWAQSTTFISRMVFDAGRDAGISSNLASRSVTSRLGTWQAGVDTFGDSSFARKLFGYGPESAYPHYYPNIPPSVIRSEDFRSAGIFDRLHADVFDIVLNFGIFGWTAYVVFFCALIFGAARGLFDSGKPVSLGLFAMVTLACGAMGAVIAELLGFSYAVAPAACLGIGSGWMLFMWLNARPVAAGQGDSYSRSHQGDARMLSAGMAASLLTFWLDAQISIPLSTSRITAFAVAALLLAELQRLKGSRTRDNEEVDRSSCGSWVDWGFAFALVAACSSFLPVVSTENMGSLLPDLGLRLISIGGLALLGAWFLVVTRRGQNERVWWQRALVIFGLPLAYGVMHLALRFNADASFGPQSIPAIAGLVAAGPIYIFCLCIVSTYFYQAESKATLVILGFPRMLASAVIALSGCLAAFGAWKAQVADIAMTSSRWNIVRDPDSTSKLVAVAIAEQPYEWQYRRVAIQRHLAEALATLSPAGLPAGRSQEFRHALQMAEAGARDAVRLEPDNPWPVILLANILQVRALRLVRAYDADGGENAELESEHLYVKVERMFPAQPLIYRNWAHLKFDRGLSQEGYRLLDKMESIIPAEPEPYVERIRMAQRFGDVEEERATLERAAGRLNPEGLAIVVGVAKKHR